MFTGWQRWRHSTYGTGSMVGCKLINNEILPDGLDNQMSPLKECEKSTYLQWRCKLPHCLRDRGRIPWWRACYLTNSPPSYNWKAPDSAKKHVSASWSPWNVHKGTQLSQHLDFSLQGTEQRIQWSSAPVPWRQWDHTSALFQATKFAVICYTARKNEHEVIFTHWLISVWPNLISFSFSCKVLSIAFPFRILPHFTSCFMM